MLGDQIVTIGTSTVGENRPDHPIRVVEVRTTPHTKRGKYRGGSTGPGSDGVLRIATNLLDVPAETIAVLYEYRWRWTIEIFFRFFKHVLGCRHLLSHDEHGIEIQTYCVIIVCMLISLWTGAHEPPGAHRRWVGDHTSAASSMSPSANNTASRLMPDHDRLKPVLLSGQQSPCRPGLGQPCRS